jgi:hypothetical protein
MTQSTMEFFAVIFDHGLMKILRFQLFLGGLICVASMISLSPSHAGTVDVSADGQTYVVDGGVIHHSRYDKDRTEASTCEDCHWRINVLCLSWDDSFHGWCPTMLLNCPRDQRFAEVFRADALTRPSSGSSLWHRTGYTCLTDGGPASTRRIRDSINQQWRINVPPLNVTTLPPNTTLVNLPTKVTYLTAATTGNMSMKVAGIPVTFRARATRSYLCKPTWLCSYSLSSANSISFKRVGSITVYATAVWTATYDALGLTNLPVTDPNIVQSDSATLTVTSLHRHLK